MAKARPQLDKMANGKKKPMSRTSGVAGRKLGRSEGIATKLKYGAPLTGSASGVKSISLKDAGEVLTSGIVTLGKKGLQADPASLAMALPLGKVAKALQGLKAAGKIAQAGALEARLLAKAAGSQTARTGGSLINDVAARNQSTSVFPRISSGGPRTAPNRILEMQGQRRAGQYTDMDRVNDFMSGYPTSKAGAKAFGRAAAKEVAKNAKTPKMTPQQAQDSYERVSGLIRGGQSAKAAAKKTYPKPKFTRGVKGSAPYMEKLLNPLFKKGRGK